MTFSCYPEYKRSRVDWIGDIPEHWDASRLRNIFSIQKRIAGKLGFNVLSITNKGVKIKDVESGDGQLSSDYSKYQLVMKGEFAMNHMDLVTGYVDISEFNGVTSPDYRVFSAIHPELDNPRFMLRLLQNAYHQRLFFPFGQGSAHLGRWRLPAEEFKDFFFPRPSRFEQTQIARFLDHETSRIDALIVEQQRLIELLKEKRQAVISHAVTKGLDPTVPMKDSGVEWLGEVPSHWVVSRAKLVSDIFVPQRNKPELNDSEGIAWVTMEDMNGGYISATNFKVTELAADEAGSKVLKKGAVIASCVGRFGIVAINSVDVVINQQLQAFEPRKIKAEYLRNIASLSKEYFELIGTAATLVYVNQQGFENLPVLIPSVSEQESICKYVDEAEARFDALLSQSFESIQLLQERRSALIAAAVTGKIDVRGWQPPAGVTTPELAQEAV